MIARKPVVFHQNRCFSEILDKRNKQDLFFKTYLIVIFLLIFLFPFSIKNTANNILPERFIYNKKIKRKSDPQPRTEPLPILHLAVPRQHINFKMTYFWASLWSNCTVSEKGKGGMALSTVQNNNTNKKINE